MLAFDMIEYSRLIAQNNSNLVIKRGDIHMLVARHLHPKASRMHNSLSSIQTDLG